MHKNLLTKAQIDEMEGLQKQHFLNLDAQRVNKSLGDRTGMTGLGFHIISVPPGKHSTEFHRHYFEDECVYVLSERRRQRSVTSPSRLGRGTSSATLQAARRTTLPTPVPKILSVSSPASVLRWMLPIIRAFRSDCFAHQVGRGRSSMSPVSTIR